MERVWLPVAPLLTFTNFSGRLGRRAFGGALLIGAAALAVGRLMDWLVFASMPRPLPAYFVAIIGVWLAIALPSLCARRLRDAGLGRSQALFLLLIPPIGWPGLACLLTRPTRDRPTNDGRC